HAGLAPAEIFCDKGLGTWQDSFAVLQKPVGDAKAAARSPFPIFDDRRVAARAYAQAASSQPPSPLHALTLAALRRAEGDRAGAAAVLKAGAQAHPGHAALRQRLAEVSLEFGSPGVAIDQAAALFASKPFERPQVKALAELFGQLDDEARKQLRTRLPSEVAQLRRVGVLADGSASFALSRFVWEALAALEPLNKGVREYVALALLGCGARAEAMEVFAELRRAKLADGSLDRTVMVQKAIDAIRAGVYLEIGVSRGVNIFQIAAPTRLGVDPKFGIPGGIEGHPGCDFFRLPSDAFFAQPPRVIEPQGIDVAFVDGLHVYAQALRDVENCLRFLKPGGAIFMHDCLPANEAEAQARVEDARRMPGFTGSWTGDVYRAIVHMRALHPELRVAVVDVDHGVGIVERGKPESTLKMTAAEVARLSYADLKADPQRLLNLKPRKWFDSWLKRFASGRAA
ncbi:MAG: class I SAM-dependent methyltransferase, partial [Betaproteobacteria bacterium]|nr:class I SAM-dependent methyltransferase [Betaproteobacteria bacterium]